MTALKKKNILWFLLGLSLTISTAAHAATGYQAGHSALEIWNSEGQASAPQWVQVCARFAIRLEKGGSTLGCRRIHHQHNCQWFRDTGN